MGTPGVPIDITPLEIVDAIKKTGGRINKVAEMLSCSHQTIRNLIALNPELIDILAEYRNKRDESLLNGAEDTLQYALDNKEKDINASLKSAFYVLNNKGRNRGYSPNNVETNVNVQLTPQQAQQIIDANK